MSDASDAAQSDDDEPQPKKRHFRFVDVLTELPNGDTAAAAQLLLTERGLTSIDSLEALRSLKKLELRGNHLTSLEFLEMNHELCWLGVAKNRLRRLSSLQNLASLAVLDISDNRIARLDGLTGLTGLKALIAARNRISHIQGLSPQTHPALETLVLSNNSIAECRLANFAALRKLSVAHNQLHAFPELRGLPALSELRLNGNRVGALASNLGFFPKLSILDVGNNLFSKPEQLEPLQGLLWLKSLNVLGNSVASDMESPALKRVFDSLKSLEILNNRRLAGGSQKKRRQPWDAKKPPPAAQEAQEAAAKPPKKRPRLEAAPEPSENKAAISIHGRAFQGRRAVFDDDEDEDASTQARQPAAVPSTDGVAEKPKKNKGRKKPGKEAGSGPDRPVREPATEPSVGKSKAKESGQHAPKASKLKKKKKRDAAETLQRPKELGQHEPKGSKLKKKRDAAETPQRSEELGQYAPKASKLKKKHNVAEAQQRPDDQGSSTRTGRVKRKKKVRGTL